VGVCEAGHEVVTYQTSARKPAGLTRTARMLVRYAQIAERSFG